MLQGDDRGCRWTEQQDQLLSDDHLELARRLARPYDLIVFPESSLDTDPQLDPDLRRRSRRSQRTHDAACWSTPVRPHPARGLQLQPAVQPDGKYEGLYSKQHLVPFGEYVPLRAALGFIGALRQVPSTSRPATTTKVFRVAGHPIGTVMCFESAFGPLVRDFVRDGAQAIVVSTNNRSYHRSGNAEQHLANSQMRAAETAGRYCKPHCRASAQWSIPTAPSATARALREGNRRDHDRHHDR